MPSQNTSLCAPSGASYEFDETLLLMSTTDKQGLITHCNEDFAQVSGFTKEELLGKPHNIVRHPDMPPEAFKDLWSTIGHGRTWNGLVKNLRKDGRYYWVNAYVTPVMMSGKPIGYMSVRTKPSAQEIEQACKLHARIAQQRTQGKEKLFLRNGRVRINGWRNWVGKLQRANVTQRQMVFQAVALALALGFPLAGWTEAWQIGVLAALLIFSFSAALFILHSQVTKPLELAQKLAGDIASGELSGKLPALQGTHPVGLLIERMRQIHVNLRAVIGDAKDEIDDFNSIARQFTSSAGELATRAQTQAQELQHTASAMHQMAQSVESSRQMVEQVQHYTDSGSALSAQSEEAMDRSRRLIEETLTSSQQMGQIISTIEGIAFQTNILALNAAVEAARAGEQGRGFAVVATEVRTLAGRSAEAAKEIRQLIINSGAQIERSAAQINTAADAMSQSAQAVEHVRSEISSMLESMTEQSAGINDVHHSLSGLDQTTQDNARMAQDYAHSAKRIDEGTGVLRRTLDVFRF